MIKSSPLADVIRAHWASLQRQSITVPEWPDPDGNPSVIWFDPPSLAERDKVRKAKGNEQLVEIIILKASDADGNRLFTLADKMQLLNAASPAVVARIAERILNSDIVDAARLGEP